MMSKADCYPVPNGFDRSPLVDEAAYQRMYEQSLNEPEKFWGEQGKRLHWMKPFTRVKNTSFTGDVNIRPLPEVPAIAVVPWLCG